MKTSLIFPSLFFQDQKKKNDAVLYFTYQE